MGSRWRAWFLEHQLRLQARLALAVEFVYGPLADNPQRVGAPLRAPFQGCWRARRGEYRLRYEIDDVGGTVTVLDVEHRRDAYRS